MPHLCVRQPWGEAVAERGRGEVAGLSLTKLHNDCKKKLYIINCKMHYKKCIASKKSVQSTEAQHLDRKARGDGAGPGGGQADGLGVRGGGQREPGSLTVAGEGSSLRRGPVYP